MIPLIPWYPPFFRDLERIVPIFIIPQLMPINEGTNNNTGQKGLNWQKYKNSVFLKQKNFTWYRLI
jgi:hypothetical protein